MAMSTYVYTVHRLAVYMYVTYIHIDIKFTVHLPLTNNQRNDNSRGMNHYTGMYAACRKMHIIMIHGRMQGNSEKSVWKSLIYFVS